MTETHTISVPIEVLGTKTDLQRWITAVDVPNDAEVHVLKSGSGWHLTFLWKEDQ